MNRQTMMKWVGVAFALLVCSSAALAQQGRGRMNMDPKEIAQRTVDRLTEQLQLDKAQQDSIYQFQLAQSEEMGKLFQAGQGGDREAMRAKMTSLREETDKKILSVLTPEQQAGYKKIQAERMNRGPRGGGNAGGRPV
ncbi:hypothetical protein ACFOET_16045 [Parapedobacter deserti]|uniref:Periplasmic heavy metal sensor n=1 Tax=Parapedobacter deserti TaxID=1912957 RepID=A0ABV7JV25_9SPHI